MERIQPDFDHAPILLNQSELRFRLMSDENLLRCLDELDALCGYDEDKRLAREEAERRHLIDPSVD